MRFLVLGLGSMGKRRIRNLKAIGFSNIIGYDIRNDRRKETEEHYGICTIDNLNDISNFDVLIISTSPDAHNEYIRYSLEKGKPCFVELNVILNDLPKLNKLAKSKKILVAPSCTFKFHPSIKNIKKLIHSSNYGKITNFVYHSGQYLPDWHPWENIKDFFVGKKETSGCKEILSFELHWVIEIMGKPREIFSFHEKTLGFDVDIDDTYVIGLKFDDFLGVLLIDVVSRFPTRNLTLNLEKAQIRWNWEEKKVKLYNAGSKSWTYFSEPEEEAEAGYNKKILEEMYIEEMRAFIEAVKGNKPFPNSLDEDIEILNILEKVEQPSNV